MAKLHEHVISHKIGLSQWLAFGIQAFKYLIRIICLMQMDHYYLQMLLGNIKYSISVYTSLIILLFTELFFKKFVTISHSVSTDICT